MPTVAASTYSELRPEVDELVALMTPELFYGVGEWYEDFSQTSDAEVTDLLERARSWTASPNFEVVVGKGSRNDRNGHESKLGGENTRNDPSLEVCSPSTLTKSSMSAADSGSICCVPRWAEVNYRA